MKRALIVFVCLFALTASNAFAAGLKDYVTRPDDSYSYEITESREMGGATVHIVKLTSQTWQGIVWEHWLPIFVPTTLKSTEKALLVVGGGNNGSAGPNFESEELKVLATIAATTGSICAGVMQVPNQPLFDGKTEDEIIAFTQEKYIRGKGEDWPLLYPMVKSAVRAMDTVQSIAKEKNGADIQGFMLTGASKRGWTSWLSAVADTRVQAIAPIVIDVLNMPEQMKHQANTYGGYSEQVADYTERNLQEQMETPMGRQLLTQVDPYSFRAELTLPKLIVLGTNDPYWTVDAANLYYDGLAGTKYLCYQANTEHDISLTGVATISSYYNAFLKGAEFPTVSWEQDPAKLNEIHVTWTGEGGKAVLWQAVSSNRDFRGSKWSSSPLEGTGATHVSIPAPESGYVAYYVEVQFPGLLGLTAGLSSKMTVIPDTFAPQGTRTYELKALETAAVKKAE
jgi:PhoPQ-activated pathogenicity-related protein